MTIRTIELPGYALRADVDAVDQQAASIGCIFSTGAGVIRHALDGSRFEERLSLDPKHCQLDALNNGAPILDSHDTSTVRAVLGVTMRAVVDGRTGRARFKLSRRPEVAGITGDIRDGVLRSVSIGYRIFEFTHIGTRTDGLPIYLATSWQPKEISLVSLPADDGAQIERAAAPWMPSTRARIVPPDWQRLASLRLAQARARVTALEV